jgi:hypothetical protein
MHPLSLGEGWGEVKKYKNENNHFSKEPGKELRFV